MQAAFPRLSLPARAGIGAAPVFALRAGLAACALLLAVPAVAQTGAAQPAHHPAHPASHGRDAAQTAAHNSAHSGAHAVAHPGAHAGTHPHPGTHAASVHHPAHRAAVVPPPVAKPVVPVPVPAAPAAPSVPAKGSSSGLPLPRFASLRADAVNLRGGPGTRYPIQWVYKRRDLPVRIEREFDVWRLVEDSDGVKGWVHQATLVGTRTFVIPGQTAAQTTAQTTAQTAAQTAAPAASGSDAPAAEVQAAAPSSPGTPASGQPKILGSSSAPTVAGRFDAANGVIPTGAVALRAAPQPDGALVAVLMPGIVGRIRSCSPGSGWCKVSLRDYAGWLPRDSFWGLLPDETILPP